MTCPVVYFFVGVDDVDTFKFLVLRPYALSLTPHFSPSDHSSHSVFDSHNLTLRLRRFILSHKPEIDMTRALIYCMN